MSKFTILSSATRTTDATVISAAPDEEYKGVLVGLDITSTSGVPTLDVKLQRQDWLTGNWVDIPGGSLAQQTTVTSVDLIVYPGIGETSNRSVNDSTTDEIRTIAAIGGTVAYSISGRWLK